MYWLGQFSSTLTLVGHVPTIYSIPKSMPMQPVEIVFILQQLEHEIKSLFSSVPYMHYTVNLISECCRDWICNITASTI